MRGVVWVDRLAQEIELSDKSVLKLLSGLPGTGKSTELRRLARRLGDAKRANLLPVIVDAERSFDLTSEIDIPDIIAAIVHGIEVEVLKLEGIDPANALGEGYLARLWNWATKTDLALKEAEFSVPEVGTLLFELRSRESLRQKFRGLVSSKLTTFLSDAAREVEGLRQRARSAGRSDIVVLVDTLEKLRGTSQNYDSVLNSAERVFKGGAPYLRLPVHAIYMAPAALFARGIPVELLPMLKLRDRSGQASQSGLTVARELVRRRVPDDVLREVLGDTFEARTTEIIEWSGGYPREIVRMTQRLFTFDAYPLAEQDTNRLLSALVDEYRSAITKDDFEWLATVHLEKFVTAEREEHRQSADRMLTMNAVMRYWNDEPWWDIHPAVRRIPGVADAIKRLRTERSGQRGEQRRK